MSSYPLNPQQNLTNFRQLIDMNADTYPQDIAFQFQRNRKLVSITYQKFRDDIQTLSSYFFQQGLSRSKIAVLGENSYEWILTYFSVVMSNNIIVPIDRELPNEDIAYLLDFSSAELLVYADSYAYENTISILEQAIEEKDAQAAPRAFMDAVRDLSSLPYFRLFLSDLRQLNSGPVENFVVGEARTAFEEYILSDGQKDAAYMREQANAVRFVQERYSWFLTEAFQRGAFEKKKGQRKIPLAQQIYENCLDAFVSGVSLGKSPEVDAPQVNIQYAVLEIDEKRHELVEKLYFDRLEDFVYVELMRGLQRGFVPKRCTNCGRWFLQTPGASYNYCDQPAPNSEEGKTCREVGSSKSFRAKVLNNEIWAIHQRAYKKYFARTKKGTMTKPDFLAWETESERLRDEALSEYDRAKTEDEKATIAERLREELNRQ